MDSSASSAAEWIWLHPRHRPERPHDEAPSPRKHSDVEPGQVYDRWAATAQAWKYQESLELAETLVEIAPEWYGSWLAQATSLFSLGRTRQAYHFLLPVTARFPENPWVRYDLAYLACELGNLDAARKWLLRATDFCDTQIIRRRALNDRHLQPLWTWVRGWA